MMEMTSDHLTGWPNAEKGHRMSDEWERLVAGGRQAKVRVTDLAPDPSRPHLWPSVGEYPIYDAFLYHAMLADRHRNAVFRDAVIQQATGARVVEIGCGPDLLWSLCALGAGAEWVDAIESLDESVRRAEELAGDRAPGRIRVVAGLSTEVTLPERASLCIAELVGCIGGSEGMARVIEDARRRHLAHGARVVPHRVRTLAGAVSLADLLPGGPGVPKTLVPYVESVFQAAGGFFDLRMCVGGIGYEAVRSTTAAVEDLRFNDGTSRQGGELRLAVTRPGPIDGLLLWLDLQGRAGGPRLDTLATRTSWLPVYVPLVSAEPLVLAPDDLIELRVTCELSADGVHPDYRFTGSVQRAGGRRSPVTGESCYAGSAFRGSPLHAALFDAAEPAGSFGAGQPEQPPAPLATHPRHPAA